MLASWQKRTRQTTHDVLPHRLKMEKIWGAGLLKLSGMLFSNSKRCTCSLIIVPNMFILLPWSNLLFKGSSGKWPMN